MRNFTVDQKGELLDYLFGVLSDTKKTRVRQFLKFKCVAVNNTVTTRHNYPLQSGDKVSIQTGKQESNLQPEFGVRIVYEDDFIVVADKPCGLLTIATEKIQKHTAIYAVNEYLNRKDAFSSKPRRSGDLSPLKLNKKIFIVHRLDKDTSGLIVFAKNEEVKFHMQENWGQVKKKYYAIVEGVPKERKGTIASYLRENQILRMVASSRQTPDSKYAITHYQVLESGPIYSLLEVDLETGRKHQIRVHLTSMGCPVAGDKDYGSRTNPAGRMALHAFFLAFKHPVTGEKKEFQLELPPVLKHLLPRTISTDLCP